MMESKYEWENLHKQTRFRPKYPNEIVVQWLFHNFKRNGQEKVLDLGCGAGRHISFMGTENIIPYGIDISAPGVAYTRALLKKIGLQKWEKNILCSSFTEIPFENESFDGLVAYGSLYYSDLAGIKKAISEIRRTLKKGGIGLIVVRGVTDYRYGKGREIEPNTFIIDYKDIKASANAESGMVMHFFTDIEIENYIIGRFTDASVDTIRSTKNGGNLVDFNYVINIRK